MAKKDKENVHTEPIQAEPVPVGAGREPPAMTPFKTVAAALIEIGLIQEQSEIFAYKEYPDAPVHTYRDPKTNIVHENVRIDAWDRGALLLVLTSGLKLRLVAKQGTYFVRAAPGIEMTLLQWVEEYKRNQKRELDRIAAERAKK